MAENVEDIYVKLRDRYNELGFGYTPTESGSEFGLLKRFFSPEDAVHFLEMEKDKFFTVNEYAEISGREIHEANSILEDMSKRGLIFRLRRDGQLTTYRLMPVVHGLYEFNLDHIESEWLGAMLKHSAEGWATMTFGAGVPFYRSLPINKEVVEGSQVLPYYDAKSQLKKHSYAAVAPCACRVASEVAGGASTDRKEICLCFDEMAKFYVENGIGREISMEEAEKVIDDSLEMGNIIQSTNSKDSEIMCSCNLQFCGILQTAKYVGGNAMANWTHYAISYDQEKCTGCGECITSCTMQSITLDETTQKVITDATCAGCGHCVTVCPENARILKKKADDEIRELPQSLYDAYVEMQDYRIEHGLP